MTYRLYQGDCLDVLKTLEAGSVDAVITDPPYGVSFIQGQVSNRRGAWTKFHHTPIAGDSKPFDPRPWLFAPVVVMFGANNFADKLPPSRGWVFWHKRPGMAQNDFGDGEMIWTNQDRVIRYFEHRWNGVLRASENGDEHYHPTQKPVALMQWLIRNYTKRGDTILDPFMGSGTTGVACRMEGRNFIGVELDPHYYAIAERRIANAQPPLLLADAPVALPVEQATMFAGAQL
jgi:site-specific DNA-methyltransferase (adenine-specific)